MTDVRIERNESRVKISAKGHSGYAEAGHDIVCAAVSTVFSQIIMSVGLYDKDGIAIVREDEKNAGVVVILPLSLPEMMFREIKAEVKGLVRTAIEYHDFLKVTGSVDLIIEDLK